MYNYVTSLYINLRLSILPSLRAPCGRFNVDTRATGAFPPYIPQLLPQKLRRFVGS